MQTQAQAQQAQVQQAKNISDQIKDNIIFLNHNKCQINHL